MTRDDLRFSPGKAYLLKLAEKHEKEGDPTQEPAPRPTVKVHMIFAVPRKKSYLPVTP